jgi:hypothetical protein
MSFIYWLIPVFGFTMLRRKGIIEVYPINLEEDFSEKMDPDTFLKMPQNALVNWLYQISSVLMVRSLLTYWHRLESHYRSWLCVFMVYNIMFGLCRFVGIISGL